MKISKLYGIIEDHDKEKLYLKMSSEQRITDENKSRIDIQEALNGIVKEQHKENKKVLNTNNLKIASIIIATLLLTSYIHSYQKKKDAKVLQEKTKLLHHKRMKIKEKEEEIEKLQNQMNESFTEVINLAKENSPEFSSRFKEVYPIVYEKILKVNPKIKTSELTFFAYLYFGFSTKDIATYTCVTVHAVEVRKNRFRKKYNISSDVDLNNWIEKLE
ncbi:helix-turn-helix transcriptional regulator [Elizabethkingia anophelis]|nr:hypothetical protein [Elizabethkingia anophelis]MDC8027421.1 hypothetical protein [Elizabethkingia anophelis]